MTRVNAVHLLWALKKAILAIEKRERSKLAGKNFDNICRIRCEELAELLAEITEAPAQKGEAV